MNLILGILCGMCLLYFAALAAVGMDFSQVWLAAALFFGGVLSMRIYAAAHGTVACKGVKWAVIFLLGMAVLVFAFAEYGIVSGMKEKPEGKLDYLIVLGAQVRGETPSKALSLRLNMAEKVWRECGKPVLLLSGGKGSGENISEAECMRRVLAEKGIPESKMILEEKSTSTLENLQFCAELSECRSKRTGIVTNNFHVYRARMLAKKLGYENICGAAAKSDWRYQIHYMVREAFALIKEKVLGNI